MHQNSRLIHQTSSSAIVNFRLIREQIVLSAVTLICRDINEESLSGKVSSDIEYPQQ